MATKEAIEMTRDQVLEWMEKQLGIRSYRAIGDGEAIHRLEWIATAVEMGDWTIDEVKSAIDQTAGIKPLPERVDEIYRILFWKRWEKWQRKSSTQ